MKRVLLSAMIALSAPVWADEPVTVLKAAHIFDSISGKLADGGLVVVRGQKIEQVGANARIPDGAKVIDLGDATLMPGFIDAHVHLSNESSDDYFKDFFNDTMRFPAEQSLYGAHYAKLTLEAGVTSVRDVGSPDFVALGLRNAINAGMIPGPHMLIANYAIGVTGGHADDPGPVPPDRLPLSGPLQGICNGPDECRHAVRLQIKFGANVIKMVPSGGVFSLSDPVDNPQLTEAEINAIISEAHLWGRKVAAHCHGDRAAKMVIAAGVDSIEHGSFLKDDTLEEMKRKHVFLVPTLFALDWSLRKVEQLPPVIAEKVKSASAASQTMFQHAVKIGTPIAMGTDAAVDPHGMNAREFILMVKNGMTPAQALMAGTAGGAELLGIADHTGSLQAGKIADIVALPGNPTQAIEATQHPLLVMKDGVTYVGGQ